MDNFQLGMKLYTSTHAKECQISILGQKDKLGIWLENIVYKYQTSTSGGMEMK